MKKVSSDIQIMQPLETRRMMSVTAGTEPAPAMSPMPAVSVVQGRHPQDGLDRPTASVDANAVGAQPNLGGFHFVIDSADSVDFENHLAAAIAQGTAIAISPTDSSLDPQRISPEVPKPTTLSDLYAALGNSTVAEIDNATNLDSLIAKTALIGSIQNLSPGDDSTELVTSFAATASESSQLASTNKTPPATPAAGILLASIARPSGSESPVHTDLGLLNPDSNTIAQPQPAQATPAPAAWLLSRDTLQSLERQLAAVQNYSRGLVMNIGRERPAELAHLTASTDSSSEADSISGWKAYAVMVGAAVAGVVYSQNEIVRGQKKLDATFSSKLIHAQAI